MGQPSLTRFWVKVSPNGKCFPMFSPDGSEHHWPEFNVEVAKVLFMPFSFDLANKVREKGNIAISKKFDPISIDIPKGAELEYFRRNPIRLVPHYYCGNAECRNIFDLPANADVVCPKCFAKNEWWCTACKQIDDHPLFFDDGQVRCSTCESTSKSDGLIHTHGLKKVIRVAEVFEEQHRHFHVLRVVTPERSIEYRIFENGRCFSRTFTAFKFRDRLRRLYSKTKTEIV